MIFSKWMNQFFQRASCHLKSNAYFVHTSAMFPAVMFILPKKKQVINNLLRKLTNQQNFTFADMIKSVKIQQEESQKQNPNLNQSQLDSIYGINFNNKTRFIYPNKQGRLQLYDCINKQQDLVGIILFQSITETPIRYINNYLYQNVTIAIKIIALMAIFKVFYELKYSARLQNHELRR